MKGAVWQALAAACVPAAVFVGTALAANSGSFGDPSGDAGASPDITGVAISSDDAGMLTIKVTLANRGGLSANDEVTVGIDSDQNPDTGAVFYGAEFALDLVGGTPSFLHASADGYYEQAISPSSFQASSGGGVVTFTVKASDVGVTAGFNIHVVASAAGILDSAPDIRTLNYQLVAGTPSPPLAPDRRAPIAEAVKSKGLHGKVADLGYFAADGRGETSDTIAVYRGSRVLKRIVTRLEDTNPYYFYTVPWRVPKNVRGKLRFCVTSVDRALNRSNQSCAALTIR